ncbi:hypothetical protein [Halalkalibacter urbisdiaboli]|uniref:hypothetical protein n=1 Tax=Halalkalibacter urbisdiaboli TaxID=1960589 RepID=UPI000B446E15|nr:hypothetical protein [Halalkalibacter urbisdiaboli]
MEQVIQTFKRSERERRLPVLRLEMNYELATLHDAMLAEDLDMMKQCKEKLERLRVELIQLEGL